MVSKVYEVFESTLSLFELGLFGEVRWAADPPADLRRRRAPWGSEAGGREVLGRGRMIRARGCVMLSVELAYVLDARRVFGPVAFREALEWTGGRVLDPDARAAEGDWRAFVAPVAGGAAAIEKTLATVRALVRLDDAGEPVWAVTRGAGCAVTYYAGTRIAGMQLSAGRGPVARLGGTYLHMDDVRFAAAHGRFQWS